MPTKKCRICVNFGYIKDDRSQSVVCKYGKNFDLNHNCYYEKAPTCPDYKTDALSGLGKPLPKYEKEQIIDEEIPF